MSNISQIYSIGSLVRDENVRVHLRVEELIKVHFGIFGFTGAGKSNLLSTLVRKLLSEVQTEPVKIVIFDLMSEYTGLLSGSASGARRRLHCQHRGADHSRIRDYLLQRTE